MVLEAVIWKLDMQSWTKDSRLSWRHIRLLIWGFLVSLYSSLSVLTNSELPERAGKKSKCRLPTEKSQFCSAVKNASRHQNHHSDGQTRSRPTKETIRLWPWQRFGQTDLWDDVWCYRLLPMSVYCFASKHLAHKLCLSLPLNWPFQVPSAPLGTAGFNTYVYLWDQHVFEFM